MKRLPIKPIVVVVLTALVIFLGLLVLRHPGPINPLSVPVPNGYDELVKAGQRLLPEPAAIDNLRSEELRSLVGRNADAIECSRGGVIIDALVGVACQSIGCQSLLRLSNNLQAADCREAIRQLEEINSKAESVTEIVNREGSWSRRTFGWRGQLARLRTIKTLRQTEQGVTAKVQAQQRTARLLLIDLAARAYELDKRERPKTVEDLVPNYLKAAPRDPVSGSEMIKMP